MALLNKPIIIRNLELSNRLVMPPIATAKSDDDDKVTNQMCDYYSEKSKGGYLGLIITEHSYVSMEGKAHKGQLSISRDEDVEGLKKLVDCIHKNNTKVIAQISHAGGLAQHENSEYDILSASAVQMPKLNAHKIIPKEMTINDIYKVIDDFLNAFKRAKIAGFDGVELHSAHGYLLNQFYSPLTNKRTDKYNGDSIEGRIKLHLDIIDAIRSIDKDYFIAVRLGGCDYVEGGTTIKDSVEACKIFQSRGVDLLDISGGFCSYRHPIIKEQGYFSEITEQIKKNVSIPVILTGGITSADVAEKLLINKKADLIGVGRAILKDSDWAKKAIIYSN